MATEAQFTPKSVETAEERQKLMLRVKLQGDPAVLDKYHRAVKTGVRSLGFVRISPKIVWPDELAVEASALTRQDRAGEAPLPRAVPDDEQA